MRASDNGPRPPARYGQNDRTIAIGRKNYLFAGSDAGGRRAAAIYSLIESAKLNVSTRSTISPMCSPASPIIRLDASPNSCPGTGNRSTPPALPPKPAPSPSGYVKSVLALIAERARFNGRSAKSHQIVALDKDARISSPWYRRTILFGQQ